MFHKNVINVNKDLESDIKANLILETLSQISTYYSFIYFFLYKTKQLWKL